MKHLRLSATLLLVSTCALGCGSDDPAPVRDSPLEPAPPESTVPESTEPESTEPQPARAEPTPEAAPAPPAGHICALAEQRTQLDLLAGRLHLSVLPGIRARPNLPSNIMGPSPPDETSTNAELRRGRATLVVRARELLVRSPADLQARGAELLADLLAVPADSLEPRDSVEGLPAAYVAAPRAPAPVDGIRTLLAALVDPGDGHLVFVGIGLGGLEGRLDLEDCGARASEMMASLAAGERVLDVSGGTRSLTGLIDLSVRLPEGWLAIREEGADFVVHRLLDVAGLGEGGASVGVYLGYDPAMSGRGAPAGRERLLGRKAELFSFREGPGRLTEAVVEAGPEFYAHVWFTGPDPAAHDAAHDVARTLAVSP